MSTSAMLAGRSRSTKRTASCMKACASPGGATGRRNQPSVAPNSSTPVQTTIRSRLPVIHLASLTAGRTPRVGQGSSLQLGAGVLQQAERHVEAHAQAVDQRAEEQAALRVELEPGGLVAAREQALVRVRDLGRVVDA